MFEIMYFVSNHIYFVGVHVTIQEGTEVKRGELEQANMMMIKRRKNIFQFDVMKLLIIGGI
jgi:hypothetical protein